MKLTINKSVLTATLKAVWAAVKPILAGAIGAGIISYTTGCSSLSATAKAPRVGAYAFGFPAIAWVDGANQSTEYPGGDTNTVTQTAPVSVDAALYVDKEKTEATK